jgi:hypothetical protein
MFWPTFAIFLICLLAESLTSWLFIRGSKKKHPALWGHAGCPTIMRNGDLISAWPLIRYVSRREYVTIEDPVAISFADRIRVPMVVSYWATLGSVAAFFFALLLGS